MSQCLGFKKTLAIISSTKDIEDVSVNQEVFLEKTMQLSEAAISSMRL